MKKLVQEDLFVLNLVMGLKVNKINMHVYLVFVVNISEINIMHISSFCCHLVVVFI